MKPKYQIRLNYEYLDLFFLTIVWVFFFFFWDSIQAQVETKILGPLLIVWWTGLGPLQLKGANYEPSYVQVL